MRRQDMTRLETVHIESVPDLLYHCSQRKGKELFAFPWGRCVINVDNGSITDDLPKQSNLKQKNTKKFIGSLRKRKSCEVNNICCSSDVVRQAKSCLFWWPWCLSLHFCASYDATGAPPQSAGGSHTSWTTSLPSSGSMTICQNTQTCTISTTYILNIHEYHEYSTLFCGI